MNLPPLPASPSALDECWKLYVHRLEHGVMPFPEASQLLVAYMAWPNDRRNRDRWMATAIAFFVAEQSLKPFVLPNEPTTTEPGPRSPPPAYSAFELFGGLPTVADASLSHMMRKLNAIQLRWPRVADVLQTVVDISQEKRASIPGGASISKAHDVLLGYAAIPRRAQLAKDWSDFRDVSHLIAASAAVAFAGRELAKQQRASAMLTPLLLVPEVVLSLGFAFQKFGLAFKPHGHRASILPSKTLWRIPAIKQFDSLPLPVRRLSDADLKFLTTVRRARPKA